MKEFCPWKNEFKLMIMASAEWFKEWFDSPYYDLLYKYRDEEEAWQFTKALVEHLSPKPGAKILDVACGKGRHSRSLAEMGYDVTGFDLAPNAIQYALQFEKENLHFYQHDMRLPFWINYFDYAINLFTSFGYFRTRREHEDAMRTIAQALNNEGIFVIDYLNVRYAEEHLVKTEVKTINNIAFHISRRQTETQFFKQIQIVDERLSLKHLFTEKVYKFSLGDFTEMMAYQGLQVHEVFGDYNLGKYDVRKSPRLIMIAKKIQR